MFVGADSGSEERWLHLIPEGNHQKVWVCQSPGESHMSVSGAVKGRKTSAQILISHDVEGSGDARDRLLLRE